MLEKFVKSFKTVTRIYVKNLDTDTKAQKILVTFIILHLKHFIHIVSNSTTNLFYLVKTQGNVLTYLEEKCLSPTGELRLLLSLNRQVSIILFVS